MATSTKRKKPPTAKQLKARRNFARMAKQRAKDARAAKRLSGATRKRPAARKAAKRPTAKRRNTGRKALLVRKNGKTLFGAAAAAVLGSRKKKATKRPAKKRNSLKPFGGSVAVRKYFRHAPISAWKDAERRGQQRLFAMNGRRRKRNSADSTAEAYAEFHGAPVSGTIDVLIPDTAPKDVYVLGCLGEIKTDREDISFDPGEAILLASKDDDLIIGATKKANQAFEPNEFLGEIQSLSYITVKEHLDGEEIEYVHKLGEEGGDKPALVTNEKGQLEIVGGDYWISADGIHD